MRATVCIWPQWNWKKGTQRAAILSRSRATSVKSTPTSHSSGSATDVDGVGDAGRSFPTPHSMPTGLRLLVALAKLPILPVFMDVSIIGERDADGLLFYVKAINLLSSHSYDRSPVQPNSVKPIRIECSMPPKKCDGPDSRETLGEPKSYGRVP